MLILGRVADRLDQQMCRSVWRAHCERTGLCHLVLLLLTNITGEEGLLGFFSKFSKLPCSDKTESVGDGGGGPARGTWTSRTSFYYFP